MKTFVKIIIFVILFTWMGASIILIFSEPSGAPILFPGFTNIVGMASAYAAVLLFEYVEDKGLTFTKLED